MVYEICPKCGGEKIQLTACKICGYSRKASSKKKFKKSHSHNRIHKAPTGKLPEFGKRKNTDLFNTGLVVSGGGVGVGKVKGKK